ncbi:MAG TPA: class I SAM-dependent methyltransferase [Candidatus Binatia bacterium]|nr:class I SAM-dependent methyltransferase [Candidatus Binatia bacterium]
MDRPRRDATRILPAAAQYWTDIASRRGRLSATRELVLALWEFLRDSTPARLRSRFGDADYDWDYRVNTTSGAVGWHERLLGSFTSGYQPTDPPAFREMLATLEHTTGLDFADVTFIDLGSGKGRTLLMASDYPFRRIVGVELLPALHRLAQQNLEQYKSDSQKCFALESICADAAQFTFPAGPLLIYLFNPFPEVVLRHVLVNLRRALTESSTTAHLIYYNPQHADVIAEAGYLQKIAGTHRYSIFRSCL